MTANELKALGRGDIIRHVSGDSFVVLSKVLTEDPQGTRERIIAIRETEVSNPDEWEIVAKSDVLNFEAAA